MERYYCHACGAERPVRLDPSITCRHCGSEFVEKIEAENHPEQFREPRQNDGRGVFGHADPSTAANIQGMTGQAMMQLMASMFGAPSSTSTSSTSTTQPQEGSSRSGPQASSSSSSTAQQQQQVPFPFAELFGAAAGGQGENGHFHMTIIDNDDENGENDEDDDDNDNDDDDEHDAHNDQQHTRHFHFGGGTAASGSGEGGRGEGGGDGNDPVAMMMQQLMGGLMNAFGGGGGTGSGEATASNGAEGETNDATTAGRGSSNASFRDQMPPQMQLINTIMNVARHQGNGAHVTFNIGGNPVGGSDTAFADVFGVHGDIGDYAMGPRSFDRIISRLMEQTGRSGPPPATEEMMAALPRQSPSEIVPALDRTSECAICKDNFFPEPGAEETEEFKQKQVIKLPRCGHIFDEACILHWLKVNRTCPVCRKALVDEVDSTNNNNNHNNHEEGAGSLFRPDVD